MSLPVITPDWQAPSSVVAFTTTTAGGVSEQHCASLNLGMHVGDVPSHVAENRCRLQRQLGKQTTLCWLRQTHSDIIVNVNDYHGVVEGDASVTDKPQRACVVMTADCLPVLLCNQTGRKVAALHCGWKGLHHDIIGKTLQAHFSGEVVIAWLGPAISPASYEVDELLYQRFMALDADYAHAFSANRTGHYLLDLYAIARQQLQRAGVSPSHIFGGAFDTFSDTRFFSHRRNAQSGRMASLIYLR